MSKPIPQWALDLIESQHGQIEMCNSIIDRIENDKTELIRDVRTLEDKSIELGEENFRHRYHIQLLKTENARLRKRLKKRKADRLTPTGDSVPAKPITVGMDWAKGPDRTAFWPIKNGGIV